MDDLLSGWGRIAWAQCWQVTILIAGVWLVLRVVGKNRPHLACALWIVVLIKCVTPPLVSSPSGIFCWLQRPDRTAEREANHLMTGVYLPPVTADEDAVVVQVLPRSPVAAPTAMPAPARVLAIKAPEAPPPHRAWSWPSVLSLAALAWILGVLIFAALATRRLLACWRMLRRAQRIDDPALAELMDDLRRRLALRHRIQLMVTESSVGPAVIGLVRPTVILPAAIVRGKLPSELKPLLAHELIHVRRGDLWIGLLQTLALGLWWFHPLVRLASRLVTCEAERCCDEETIAHLGCDPAAYARSLLDVLALKQQLTPIPAFPGVRPVDVTSQRLERIMKLGQGCHKRTPWWCWLAMFFLAAASLPGAAFVARAKEENAKNSPPSHLAVDDHNESPTLAPREDDAKEVITRSYDDTDLIALLQSERGFSEARAETYLNDLVRSNVPASGDVGRDLQGLRVRNTAEGHKRIEEQLAVLREHGAAELTVEVRIVSGPAAVLNAEGVDWRLIGSTSQEAEQPGGVADGKEPRGTAESVVEKHLPAMLALVDEKKATELLAAAQANSKSNVIQSPKVTLFNGQSARVQDVTQRPFVVGMTPAAIGAETRMQPKIRVVCEGSTIRLRPVAQKDGPIRLDFGLTLSSIRDVDTAEFPAGPGKKPITIQVPEVASTRLNTTVEMNAEQTLVMSLPKTGKGKKEQQPLCVLVKVRKLQAQPAAGTPQEAAKATPQPEEPAAADRQPTEQYAFQTSGWRLKFTPKEGGRLEVEQTDGKGPFADFRIRGGVKLDAVKETKGKEKPDRISAAADSVQVTSRPATGDAPARLQIALDGDVRLMHNESRIEAKQIVLQIDGAFDSKFAPGRNVGAVYVQVSDARSIDVSSIKNPPNGVRFLPTGRNNAYAQWIEKIYPVADLVIPVPTGPIKISPSGAQVKRESPASDKPDCDTLIDLITTTIRPDSWESVGGQGRISTATNSLSLVIRQEERAHQQIADLLAQLRHLQDIQVVLSLERLEVSTAELERAAAKEPDSPLGPLAQNPQSRAWCLKPESVSALKRIRGAKVRSAPRITAFNGQSIDLRPAEGEQQPTALLSQLLIEPVVTADFRSLRLQIFGDSAPMAAQLRGAAEGKLRSPLNLASGTESIASKLTVELRELALGQVLLVDLSEFAWQESERGVPALEKVPHTARLFKNVSATKPDTRQFYLITPNVLVVSEQEAVRVAAPRKE